MAPARCQKSFAPGRASHQSRPCAAPYFCVLGMRESASPISTPRRKHITCGSGLDREQHSALHPSKDQTRLNPSRQRAPGPIATNPAPMAGTSRFRRSAPISTPRIKHHCGSGLDREPALGPSQAELGLTTPVVALRHHRLGFWPTIRLVMLTKRRGPVTNGLQPPPD